TAPAARIVATMAPTAPAKTWAIAPTRPFGRNSPVASVSSLPSRAAIAAPSMPSHSVSVETIAASPGIAAWKKRRAKICASGSTMRPPSATLAIRFSACWASLIRGASPLGLPDTLTRVGPWPRAVRVAHSLRSFARRRSFALALADRVAVGDGRIVDGGRHHRPAHRRDELSRRGAELAERLRVERDDLEPASAHDLDRLGVLRGRLGAHACLERLRGGGDLLTIVGGDAVPRGLRDQQRAGERRDLQVQHLFRVRQHA